MAVTDIKGGAMLGRFAIGRLGIAMIPSNTIKMLQTVVRTGFLMKLSENAMNLVDPAR